MRSRLDKVVKAMKEQGFTKFGAVGYCFGGAFALCPIRTLAIEDNAHCDQPSTLRVRLCV